MPAGFELIHRDGPRAFRADSSHSDRFRLANPRLLLPMHLRATGVPATPYYRIDGGGGYEFHSRWVAECVRRGVYLLPYHNDFVSVAHGDDDLKRTWDIADQAFAALA